MRQRGGVGIMILMLMVLLMVGYLASYALYRVTTSGHERDTTQRLLVIASDALDQFAAANARLPCPANPVADTGLEVQATAATCSFDEGTLPWMTLGMRHDDGIDGWGRKLSYRVYTGNEGSLTQPSGVSMVECDMADPVGAKTAVAASLGGLCVSNPDYRLRSTLDTVFLLDKGLTLTDFGTPHTKKVAYVVISHGATGLGGYTVSGARLDMPLGDELDNTKDTGPFTIKAFSDADTAATSNAHFDDLLIYRTLPDLVKRAGLSARDWPEI